jgi:hypothetical protein
MADSEAGGEEHVPDTQLGDDETMQYVQPADGGDERVPDTQGEEDQTMAREQPVGGFAGGDGAGETLQNAATDAGDAAAPGSAPDEDAVLPAKKRGTKKRAVLDSDDEDADMGTAGAPNADAGAEPGTAGSTSDEAAADANAAPDNAEDAPARPRRLRNRAHSDSSDGEREKEADAGAGSVAAAEAPAAPLSKKEQMAALAEAARRRAAEDQPIDESENEEQDVGGEGRSRKKRGDQKPIRKDDSKKRQTKQGRGDKRESTGKGRNKKATAPKVDKAELQRKLITQQLEKIVSTAVKEEDSTLTKRKCREVLAAIFGEARMEEFKSHLSAEVVRLVRECQNMSRDALEEFAEGCRAVTEEEIKAIDEPEPASESSEEEPPVKPAKQKSRPNPRTPTAKKPSTKKPKAPTVDVSELARKLMTQHLQMLVSIAVRDKDSSLTKKKCRELLAPIFGEALVEEHKEHINVEVVRLVGEYRVLEEEALAEVVEGCRAVTEEEVKAMDAPPAAHSGPEDESEDDLTRAEKKQRRKRDQAARKKSKKKVKKPKLAPTVDVSELARKLMTQHLQMLVSIAVRDKDSSLTKKKCRELLAPIFGEALVEEHKEHINVEVVRLVGEYRVLEEEALAEVVEGCRAVTEEEVKAMDAPPAAHSGPEDESDTQGDESDSSDRCALLHLRLAVLG